MGYFENKIQKVAIYSRKSREKDESQEVLNRQLATLLDKANKNGWEYDVYKEVGSSQEINPELDKLMDKVTSLHYDAVLVTEQSRLGRDDVVRATVFKTLANYNVLIVTPTQIIDLNTEEGSLVSGMQGLIDKQEYLNTRKRLVRGKRQSAKEGNWVNSKKPVGYDYNPVTKRLILNEYAPVIERIYMMYLRGTSSTDIARQFEIEGILTPNGVNWDKARVSVVLANPAYKGTVVYGKTKVSKVSKKPSGTPRQIKTTEEEQIVVEDAHAPIVSPEDWERVRVIREQRNSKPPSARIGKVAFTGLIRCSLCGRTHSFQRRKGKELRITSCQTRHYKDDGTYSVCKNKGMRLDKFEELFYVQFEDFVHALENYLEDIKHNIPIEATNPAAEREIIEQTIKKHGQAIKKAQRGYENDLYTDEEFAERIKELRSQITNLEKDLEKLDSMSKNEQIDEMEASVNKLRGILNGTAKLCTSEINALLCKYIDHIDYIRVGDHKALPTINIVYKEGL